MSDEQMPDDLVYGQNPGHKRPDWEEYFLKVMDTVAERACGSPHLR